MAEESLLGRLRAPFPPTTVGWRLGPLNAEKTRGMALAYIDARDVQDRLDDVCGVMWQTRHPWSSGTLIACEIGISVEGEWIWRGDGAGEIDDTSGASGERKEQAQDMARKAAFSDSFKRAAVRWGIGRYLYDLDATWVEVEPKNRSYVIPDREKARLRSILARQMSGGAVTVERNPKSPQEVKVAEALSPPPRIERQPTTAAEAAEEALAKRLADIRRRLKRALDTTNETLMPAQVLAINAADLAIVEKSLPEAYAKIVAYAKMREAEINSNTAKGSGVPLAQTAQAVEDELTTLLAGV